MLKVIEDVAKSWLTLMLAGLGVTLAPHEWIGGLFLALAAAAFAMKVEPEQNKRELWVVLMGAFIASHVAALTAQSWAPDFPVQVVMIAAGYFSRHLARFSLRLAGLVEARSTTIADRLVDRVLPPARHGKDDR
jgi:hypothetical protein